MDYCSKSEILAYKDEVLSELYCANTLVDAAKTCCLVKEFNNEYYGIPQSFRSSISNERNQYISMLTIIYDKINNICKIDI